MIKHFRQLYHDIFSGTFGSSAFAMPPPTIIKSGCSIATDLIVSGLIPPATTFEFVITDLTVRKLSKGDTPLACKS